MCYFIIGDDFIPLKYLEFDEIIQSNIRNNNLKICFTTYKSNELPIFLMNEIKIAHVLYKTDLDKLVIYEIKDISIKETISNDDGDFIINYSFNEFTTNLNDTPLNVRKFLRDENLKLLGI